MDAMNLNCRIELTTIQEIQWIQNAKMNWKQCNRRNEFKLHNEIENSAISVIDKMKWNWTIKLKAMQSIQWIQIAQRNWN